MAYLLLRLMCSINLLSFIGMNVISVNLNNLNFDNSVTEASFTIHFLRICLFKGSNYKDSRIKKRI